MPDHRERLKSIEAVIAQGPFEATWESLENYRIPEWYKNDKFGIFIHWGAYCVPAFGNEWYPRLMYLNEEHKKGHYFNHHVETYGPQKQFGYKDFIPMFKAEKFDPADWAALFEQSGARFVVPVAEHHDGFAMYDCAFSEWTAAKKGPRRDVIAEVARETRARGMTFGLSSHRAEHWWFFDGGRQFDSDVQDDRWRDLYGPAAPRDSQPDAAFLDDWLARTCELIDKFRPQIVWFDWWIEQPAFEPYLKKLAAYYYNRAAEWGLGVAINYKNRAFPMDAAVFDVERGQLSDIRPLFWQTDTSVSKNSWGYIKNHDYKEASAIIGDLADIVSKNGALLLNIGPRPDGTIPEPEREILLAVGRWLKVNGEAIYGTRPWRVFGEGPTEVAEGAFTDTKRAGFTAADIRFTRKGDALYAILLGMPEGDSATIKTLAMGVKHGPLAIRSVEMLGAKGALEWTRDGDGLHVKLPSVRPGEAALALKISQ